MKNRRLLSLVLASLALSACGGGSGGQDRPPTVTSTYTVTLTDVVVSRSADLLDLDAGGVPVDGATVTITE